MTGRERISPQFKGSDAAVDGGGQDLNEITLALFYMQKKRWKKCIHHFLP
jgi:hypothetical protein